MVMLLLESGGLNELLVTFISHLPYKNIYI